MADTPDDTLTGIAKEVLLKVLLRDADIHTRLNNAAYRSDFRLEIGNALHDRYDFSDSTESPEAIAEEILDAVITVIDTYRKTD